MADRERDVVVCDISVVVRLDGERRVDAGGLLDAEEPGVEDRLREWVVARQAAVALAELLHRALTRAPRVPQPGGGSLRRLHGLANEGNIKLRLGGVDFRDEVVAERDEVRFVVDRAVLVERYAEAGLLREARAVVVDAAEEDVEHEQRRQDEEEVAEEVAQRTGGESADGAAELLHEVEEHEKDRRVEEKFHHGEGQQARYGADAETQHAINVVGVSIGEGRRAGRQLIGGERQQVEEQREKIQAPLGFFWPFFVRCVYSQHGVLLAFCMIILFRLI